MSSIRQQVYIGNEVTSRKVIYARTISAVIVSQWAIKTSLIQFAIKYQQMQMWNSRADLQNQKDIVTLDYFSISSKLFSIIIIF